MELEEMQAAWSDLSKELKHQKLITNELIMKMTQEKYTNTWNHIRNFELFGTLICYGGLLYLLFNFGKLDTTPLQLSGAICAIALGVLPILSLKTIRGMKEVNITQMTYKETMDTYQKRKKQFVNFQRLNMVMSFIFMLVIIPVSARIFNGKDLFANFDDKLWVALPIMCVFFAGLVWFMIYTYKRVLRRSEKILEEASDF